MRNSLVLKSTPYLKLWGSYAILKLRKCLVRVWNFFIDTTLFKLKSSKIFSSDSNEFGITGKPISRLSKWCLNHPNTLWYEKVRAERKRTIIHLKYSVVDIPICSEPKFITLEIFCLHHFYIDQTTNYQITNIYYQYILTTAKTKNKWKF